MTSAPDPGTFSDTTALPDSALPRDPAEYAPARRSGFGAAFWASIVIGLILILAGAIIGFFGARLFPVHPAAQAASGSAAHALPPDLAVVQAAGLPTPAAAVSPASPAPSPAELSALAARVDKLQTDQRRVAQASAEALAAADVSEAAQGSLAFADQLARLDRLLPDSPDLRILRALAQTGAPSRAALAREFAPLADRAAVASRTPPAGSSVLARAAHVLAAIFTLRRIDRLNGNDPDAVLARAQRRVDDGDIEGAQKELAALPPAGQRALLAWRAQALRRTEIDRLVADIRAGAARDLAEVAAPGQV